ncbi:MAG TPA: hypothetical protein DCG39_06560 [Opitutae bacterium]|nr:hypothetical protein [Opitutae bacterium]
MRTLACLILFLAQLAHLHAQAIPQESSSSQPKTILEAEEEVFYDEKTQRLVALPNARLSSGKLLLSADRIEYDRNRTQAFAKGRVILTNGTFRLLAQTLEINLQNGDFEARGVKAGYYPLAMESSVMKRENGIITSSDATVFLHQRHPLEPSLGLGSLSFDQNKSRLTGKAVSLKVGNRKIAGLPSLSGNIGRNPFRYGLHAGHRDRLGWYLGMEGNHRVSDSMDAQGKITAYEERGVFLAHKLSWREELDEGFRRGSLEAGWIDDQGNQRGLDLTGSAIEESRDYLHASSLNRFKRRWRLAGRIEWQEDSEVFRDFQRDRFNDHQWNDHFGELAYEADNWTASLMTRWQGNDHEAMIEQIPSLRFDLAPTPWPKPDLYNTLSLELAGFREKDDAGSLLRRSRKLDLGYQVQRPIRLANGLTYTPFLSYRLQDYSLDGPDAQRTWGEWGNDLNYVTHGDYDLQNETWGINGLRHVMDFSLSHRKLNRLDSENLSLIPAIDRSIIDLNLGPVDLLDSIEADDLEPQEVVRVGWGNHLLTRDGQGTRSLLSLQISQDLWLENESGDDLARNFHSGLQLNPANWLGIWGEAKIDLDRGETTRNSITAVLRDGRINQLELSYFNYLSLSDQWQFLASHRINERKAVHGALRLQGDRPKMPYWRVSLEFRPSTSWIWFFHLSERTGTSKENEWEGSVSARLFSF